MTQPDDIDLLADSQFVDDAKVPVLNKNIARALEIESEIAAINEQLDRLGKEYSELRTKTLPDQLAAAGLPAIETDNGFRVELTTLVSGSLPKEDKKEPALAALRRLDGGGLIKNAITVRVDAGKDLLGQQAVEELRKLGFEPETSESVHAQTLMAWAREQLLVGPVRASQIMEAAPDIGLYIAKIAKISRVKEKKLKQRKRS